MQKWTTGLALIVCCLAMTAGVQALEPVMTEGNVAVGKFYTFNRPPIRWWGDRYDTQWSDGSKLTDERRGFHGGEWVSQNRFVAWSGKEPVRVTLDLGKPRPIKSVSLGLAVGQETLGYYPHRVVISTRQTAEEDWSVFARLAQFPQEPEDVQSRWVTLDGDETLARHVQVRIDLQTPPEYPSAQMPSNKVILDEIEVDGLIENDWPMVPETGCFHGAFPVAEPKPYLTVGAYEELVGKELSMVLWYHHFGESSYEKLSSLRARISEEYDGSRYMCVGWLPEITSQEIAHGALDEYLREWFTDSVDPELQHGIDDPMWLRPMNEMNGGWAVWGMDPYHFRMAWRRMYNIAEQIGATNRHLFVWSPAGVESSEFWNTRARYYPGDGYVDWVGISCYPSSRGTPDDPQNYPPAIIRPLYEQYADRKPFMIAEGGFDDRIDRERWVKEWFDSIRQEFPMCKAFIWENHHTRRIESDEAALQMYRQKVADDYWLDHPLKTEQ
ncbi:MAG: glycoside hydrolase family 26 protein [Armatimonadota bacterium]